MKTKHYILIAVALLIITAIASPYLAHATGKHVRKAPDIPNGVIYNPTIYRDFDWNFIRFYWFAILHIDNKYSLKED